MPEITSTDGNLAEETAVEMAPFEDDGSLRSVFGTALQQSLASHGIPVEDDAAAIADFAIAVRNASSGVANPEASTPEAISWESLPRETRWYEECAPLRLRATLVLLDRTDGSIMYRGVAESDMCSYTQEDLLALADILVEDAL